MMTYGVTISLRHDEIKDVRTLLRERVMRPIGVPDAEWSVGYGLTFLVNGFLHSSRRRQNWAVGPA